ncbi:hypothetical protein ABT295_09420, partial [Terrabacter sp. NPDC000476]
LDHEGMDHEGMDHEGMDHEGMDHEGMDHEGMDHEGMDMDMSPDGIPLAEGAEDRDGLEMDELHLKLGPVLRHWPAGLEMTWTLHGDLVAEAEARWLLTAATGFAAQDCAPAGLLADAVLDLLQLAGCMEEAHRAMRVRDRALGIFWQGSDVGLAKEADALVGRIRRLHTLRWSLRGLGRAAPGWLDERHLPSWWAGDAYDRLLALLAALHESAATTAVAAERPDVPLRRTDADHAIRLCTGVDVAAARLVIASLALHLGSLDDMRVGAHA